MGYWWVNNFKFKAHNINIPYLGLYVQFQQHNSKNVMFLPEKRKNTTFHCMNKTTSSNGILS